VGPLGRFTMTRRNLLTLVLIAYLAFLLDIALFRFPVDSPTSLASRGSPAGLPDLRRWLRRLRMQFLEHLHGRVDQALA
jgi:hypothetical protein